MIINHVRVSGIRTRTAPDIPAAAVTINGTPVTVSGTIVTTGA